ncbi:MAG: AraC family transcriptional regulator, partial [Gammaproteobacteria bacterium]|nr:AraC family transcriptional regulator [Gammaproteobacteria bacterium]
MSYKKETELQYRKKINDVHIYMQNHLGSTLNLDVLSSVANISKFHFHRIFSAVTGENVLQYIKRIRLENAAFRLYYTGDPITDIARDSGYATLSAFSKSFKNQFNCNPRGYRKTGVNLTESDISKETSFWRNDNNIIQCEVRDVDEYVVCYVRKTGEYCIAAQSAWETLLNYARDVESLSDNNNKHIGITYDSPKITSADCIRYDACISYNPDILNGIKKIGDIGIQRIPSGKFAVFKHRGEYSNLWNIYNAIYS